MRIAGSRRRTIDIGWVANLHFHTLVPEGVWHEQPDGSVTFHRLPPPTDEDIGALVVRIVRRVARLLARRDADAAIDDELDALDHARAEAVQLPMPFAEPRSQISATSRRRCALVDGFSLHASCVHVETTVPVSIRPPPPVHPTNVCVTTLPFTVEVMHDEGVRRSSASVTEADAAVSGDCAGSTSLVLDRADRRADPS